jgi:eukaryotic-like serine/threonine-protein kinase
MYRLAFFRGDTRTMEQVVEEARGKEDESRLLAEQANTEAYYGRLSRARSFSQRAVESARRTGSRAVAAERQTNSALFEAEFGNPVLARQAAAASLGGPSALAQARIGEISRAKAVAEEVEKAHELDHV